MFLQLNLDNVINATDILDFHIMKDPIHNQYVLYARRESGATAIYSDMIKPNVDKVLCDILVLMKETPLNVENQITTSVPPEVVSVTTPRQATKGEEFPVEIKLKGYVSSVSDIQLTVTPNLTAVKPLALSDDKLTAKATYKATNVANETISAKTSMGSLTRSSIIDILDTAPVMTTLTLSHDKLRKGDVTKAIATFDKTPNLTDVTFNVDGLSKHSEKIVVGSTITQDFKWDTGAFEGKITATNKSKTETALIKLENDANIQEIIPSKTQLEIGQVSTISVHFDKALLAEQVPLKITYPAGIQETQAFALDNLRESGTLKVIGGAETTDPITFELAGRIHKIVIPVLPAEKPISITADKMDVVLGEVITFTVTFNRPITDPAKFPINLSAGLQSTREIKLIENGLQGTFTAYSNTIGQKTITIGEESVNIDVLDIMEITHFNLNPEKPVLGQDVNLIITFSHAPVLKSATVRTSGGLKIKGDLQVAGDTLVGILETIDVGEQIIICEYNGVASKSHNVIVDAPPKPQIAITNNPSILRLNQKQTLTIALTNAKDYDVFNDNPCCIEYNKKTKEVKAIGYNGYKSTLTFTPKTDLAFGTPKSITIDVPKPTPLLNAVTASPTTIKENEKTVVFMNFLECEPDLSKVTMQPNGFLRMEGKMALDGMDVVATFIGVAAGAGEITCNYDNGIAQKVNITVTGATPASFTTKAKGV